MLNKPFLPDPDIREMFVKMGVSAGKDAIVSKLIMYIVKVYGLPI